ncbi:hypothetical protein [Streptomyces sp. CO7]
MGTSPVTAAGRARTGWKDELIERWEAALQDGAPPPLPDPATKNFAQDTPGFG